MTTTAGLRRFIQPLLDRHPDLVFSRRWLLRPPLRHVFGGILFDRTSSAEHTSTYFVLHHLFELRSFIPLYWGDAFSRLEFGRPEQLVMLLEELETTTIPAMRSIDTIQRLMDYVDGHHARHWLFARPATKIIFDAALGNLEEAKSIGARHIDYWSSDDPRWDDEDRQKMAGLQALYAGLVRDDRDEVARLLHEWELATVRNARLEAFWQPTPFPLELAAG